MLVRVEFQGRPDGAGRANGLTPRLALPCPAADAEIATISQTARGTTRFMVAAFIAAASPTLRVSPPDARHPLAGGGCRNRDDQPARARHDSLHGSGFTSGGFINSSDSTRCRSRS